MSTEHSRQKVKFETPMDAQKFFDANFTPTGEIYNWEAYFDSVEEMLEASK